MSSLTALTTSELSGRMDEIDRLLVEESDVKLKRTLNIERGRIIKEMKRRQTSVAHSIPDPQTIPHVFFNVELTRPASKELQQYLEAVLTHYPDHLRYIYDKSQEYTEHGGCRKMTYATWKKKLKSDLGKCKW